MSSAKPRPRWLFLISPRWLAWHAFVLLVVWGMLALGDWQFHRAEGGNALSWAYTFEWPIFAIFGVIFWAKTIIDEWRQPGGAARNVLAPHAAGLLKPSDSLGLPDAAHTPVDRDSEADDDPELAAYNAYLARLNSQRRPAAR